MYGKNQFVGIVHNGQFRRLALDGEVGDPLRLTQVEPVATLTPDTGALDLTRYEGSVLMVRGYDQPGEWVYAAEVIDVAGPILTMVVQRLFGQAGT